MTRNYSSKKMALKDDSSSSPSSTSSHLESGIFSGPPNFEYISDVDLYGLLAQKERDLVLAAELGKALLDKNDELGKQNEYIAEEFSAKLEEVEQEKYHLKRKLEIAEEEYELRVSELQNDVRALRSTLEEHNRTHNSVERDKSLVISTLSEQNQRLTIQLKESAKNEESLLSELNTLKSQVSLKRLSLSDHASHLECLRDEINLMTERKLELERRIESLRDEREGLSSNLDESADRIVMLEKQSREQERLINSNDRLIEELKTTNLALSDRIESIYRSSSLSPASGALSLQNEMEVSDTDNSLSRKLDSLLDIECDDEEEEENNQIREERILPFTTLKEEVLETISLLKLLITQIQDRHKEDSQVESNKSLRNENEEEKPNSFLDTNGPLFIIGLLHSLAEELRDLVFDVIIKKKSYFSSSDSNDKLRLEVKLHTTKELYEKTERTLSLRDEQLKKKDEEILELKSKLSVTELKYTAALDERNTLRADIDNSKAGKDELIRKAWDVRDAAVQRKNNTEIELAKTRIDVMQVNSQLLELVRQKVELSKQLEQWQVDMEELLEEQMIRKMKATEQKRKLMNGVKSGNESDSSYSERKKSYNKLLSFFQR